MSKVMIYSNEHKGWWKPYYFGYTQCSKEAGIFDLEDAIKKYPKLDYDTSNEDFLVDVSIEAIDNANPSEALVWIDKHIDWNLKKIEELKNRDKGVADIYDNENKMLVTIKQALLKAQEQNEVIVELCEYYGLDNLYPYDDLDTIEHCLKNARDISSQQRLELLGKLNKLEKENSELRLKAQEPKHYIKWEDLEFDHKPKYINVKMGDNKYLLIVGFSDVKSVVLRDNNLKPYLHLFEKDKQFFNDLHLEVVEE